MVQKANSPGCFRALDIYPTPEEILGERKFFRKNLIYGRFQDVDDYLDTQFRLLREDFVANIREALECYRLKEPTKGITIYTSIKISSDSSKNFRIDIKTDKNDKTFMVGSLLIFTRDDFRNIFLAKVLNKLSESDLVVIEFVNFNYALDLGLVYKMAECGQYFDPYFNVLNALQNISTDNFPMEKYLVEVDSTWVSMPKYLVSSTLPYKIDGCRILPKQLPAFPNSLLGLNPPQMLAFKAALTQEFVIIQGPPGTGKTHLGVKIASTFIQNNHFWYKKTPLLIISHKNDALDQFLEGLIPTTKFLIRVGGQSKSEKLKNYNLDSWKRELSREKHRKVGVLEVLEKALVVGMTTSMAARWRNILEQLRSPIMIVEEAAEVLEAHIVAALTNSCQHLILMGDHQQLQPLTADNNIGKNYQLGISLFERMVLNNVQHYQLKIQHRMRPEISNLLKVRIYPFLEDAESVKARPNIKGVTKNVFFLDHTHPEEKSGVSTKKNSFEACFVVLLAKYLIQNGYKPEEIVILATYLGQSQEISKLSEKSLPKVKVSTLDGYQGQEAEIVLLSLVRSETMGFLGQMNRVCVALSRAKSGLYILGNMNLLAKSSALWASIRNCLRNDGAIGNKLALKCVNHGNVSRIKDLDDFLNVQNGGCLKKCNVLLDCGHKCSLMCHSDLIKSRCEKNCVGSKVREVDPLSLWKPPRRDLQVHDDVDFLSFSIRLIIIGIVKTWNFIKSFF